MSSLRSEGSSVALPPVPVAGAAAGHSGPRPDGLGTWGWAVGLIVPLTLALGWECVVKLGWASGRLLPPPSEIIGTFHALAVSGELIVHVSATLGRVLTGFLFGVIAGTVLGALTGYSDWVRRLLDPTLQALRNIPSIAWVPLFILLQARPRSRS